MGLLDQLMGGGQDRDRYNDFANRYDQGSAHEGYDDDEVAKHYGQLDSEIDNDTYQSSARDAFSRMQPEERAQFGEQLRGAARNGGHNDLDEQYGQYGDDPDSLARYTGQIRERDPGLLGGLLGGGGGGGGLGSMLGGGGGGAGPLGALLGGGGGGGGGLGGMLGGGGGGGNPIARAALAGITAMAARKMMSR